MRPPPPIATPFDAIRELFGEPARQMRRAKEMHPRNAPSEAPVPGSHAAMTENFRFAHELPGVTDFRSADRLAVERAWEGARQATQERFGRSPSTDEWDQAGPAEVAALRQAVDAEAAFLKMSAAGGATDAGRDAAFARLTSAIAAWLNTCCAGWPLAAEREKQRLKHMETW